MGDGHLAATHIFFGIEWMKQTMMNIKRLRTSAVWVLIIVIGLASTAAASQIPIGLDWRESIFIQEYWVDGRPQYCVANMTDRDIRLQVSRWLPKQPLEPLGGMSLTANAIECKDAQPFLDQRYLDFQVLEGPRLGLLWAPAHPRPADGDDKNAAVTSYKGLNGACRDMGITLEQKQIWFKSGEHASLILTTPANNGKIMFIKHPEHKNLHQISPEKILSGSLPVKEKEDQMIIDTHQPFKHQAVHAIEWKFTAPAVKRPTLFKIEATIKFSGQIRGCFVRGVLIKP